MAIKAKSKEKDLDDELDLDDEEIDELEEEESSDEGSEKDESPEEGESSEEGSGEEEESSDDAELEAKRERRRREKRMKKEKDRRERETLRDTVNSLKSELSEYKKTSNKHLSTQTENGIDNELREVNNVYNTAQRVMAEAIDAHDGKKFAEAKAISDKAFLRYGQLENAKAGVKRKEEEVEKAEKESKSKQDDVLDEDGKRFGMAWAKKNSAWFDVAGRNRESKLVHTIDKDLYDEGYDPNTKEYWDELSDRVAEVVPAARRTIKAKPSGQRVGGGSNNEVAKKGGGVANLPKEFVQTLKAAGYWDEPAKRDAAIKNYRSNKKGS